MLIHLNNKTKIHSSDYGLINYDLGIHQNGKGSERRKSKKNIESQKFEKDQYFKSLILNLKTFDVLILPMASEKIRTSKV